MVGIVNADGAAETIVWLGAGALAREFAQLQAAAQYTAKYGLRRNTAKVAAQYQPVAADFNALVPAQYSSMPPTSGSCVVVTLTPSERTDQGYRQAYVDASARLIDWLLVAPPERVIFASSTSVYHRDDGGWVDENYSIAPDSFAGKRLLEAEGLWLQSDLPVACVRFSGIYGPGRTRLLEQALAGDGGRRNPPVYSNRIHQVDCARVIAHLLGGPHNVWCLSRSLSVFLSCR